MFTYDRSATPANIANLFFAIALWVFAGWGYAVGCIIGGLLASFRFKKKD